MVVTSHPGPLSKKDKLRFPLLHYITTLWVSHVKSSDLAETSLSDILNRLGWPNEPLIESGTPSSGTKLVHVVSRFGLTKLLSFLLNTGEVDVDLKDDHGRTPLSWAAENGHKTIVTMLLNTSRFDVDSKDTVHGRTPLSWAAWNEHQTIVMMLLDTGKTDVDSKDRDGRTPLS